MALIACPECHGKVSDKATSCPHCGCPLSARPIQPIDVTLEGVTIDVLPVLQAMKKYGMDSVEAECTSADLAMEYNISFENTDTLYELAKEQYSVYSNVIPMPYTQSEQSSHQAPSTPRCPTCGSTNIEEISAVTRGVALGMFGLASKTARSQFRCRSCNYKW